MGFVSKGIEVADQLLQEGDRDPGPRGQKMRKDGLADHRHLHSARSRCRLRPAKASTSGRASRTPARACHGPRAPSEDMRTLVDAYRREKRLGREHPDWLRWCRQVWRTGC